MVTRSRKCTGMPGHAFCLQKVDAHVCYQWHYLLVVLSKVEGCPADNILSVLRGLDPLQVVS